MKLLKMNGPNCLIYSAAMVLDADVESLYKEIGHNGMAKVWDLPTPLCYRNFHIQEIIDCFIRRGYGLMPIEVDPISISSLEVKPVHAYEDGWARFMGLIRDHRAILIAKNRHAIAWDGHMCYDPNGRTAKITDYRIEEAWVVVKLI
jgi:hypothetical protein